jgi:hypothetical protein
MVGDKIAGINVQLDFPSQRVRIDMQTYIDTLLLTLDWIKLQKPQLSPFIAAPIAYGQKTQTPEEDTSATLSPECLLHVQKIIGLLLYYARAVDKLLANLKQQYARNNLSTHFWTTWPRIPMMALSTELMTWYSVRTRMQATSTKPNLAAEPGHTSTFWKMIRFLASMAPS